MKIELNGVGKRYNRDWIFRNINDEFISGEAYAILGSNGSGKSTLLQLIAGNQMESEGKLNFYNNNLLISDDKRFEHISFASPYLELIEEFTLMEMLHFHQRFQPFLKGLSINDVLGITVLEKARDKELKYFSSGMKQRVKLALAVLSDTSVLLLDEPTSNLDKRGVEWYAGLMKNYSVNKLVVVCSNSLPYEYEFCKRQLVMEDFK